MKGPVERLKYDLRRVWECPECHNRTRTGGDVTHATCPCQSKKKFTEQLSMALIEDGPRRVLP